MQRWFAFFIKAVGVLLFIVEIGWFVALPFWNEIKLWPALLKHEGQPAGLHALLRQKPKARRTAWLVAILLVLFALPWPTRRSVSGSLKPIEIYPIHAPAGSQIVKLPWREGSQVRAGQPLLAVG